MSKNMMKKALKVGLALLVTGTVATSAYAEVKGSITGRAVGTFQMKSGDGGSANQMGGQGRLGYKVSSEANGWKGTGYTEIDSDAVSNRDTWVSIENDSMMYKLGRQWLGGSYLGGAYVGAELDNSVDVGYAGRGDASLLVVVKSLGLGVVVVQDEANAGDDEGVYNKTVLAARYSGKAGSLKYTAAFASVSGAIDEDRAGQAVGSVGDGLAVTKLQGGVAMDMGTMTIAGAFMSVATKVNSDATDTATTMQIGLGLDMAMGDGGLSFQYVTTTDNAGSDGAEDVASTNMFVAYKMPIGPVPLFLSYHSAGDDDVSNSVIGAELVYGF